MSFLNSTKGKILVAVVGIVIVLGLMFGPGIVQTRDTEAANKINVDNQQVVVKSYADKAWKIVAQQAQIPEKYHQDFKDSYSALINGRYQGKDAGDKAFLNFIVEHNPQYDSTLYTKLMTTIEAQREDLTQEEKKLVVLNGVHNLPFHQTFPRLALAGRHETTVTVITSDKTNEMFNNGGVENDIEIYSK